MSCVSSAGERYLYFRVLCLTHPLGLTLCQGCKSNVPQTVTLCYHVSISVDIDGHVTGITFVSGEVLTLYYCVGTSTDEGVTYCYRTTAGRHRLET